MPSAFALALPLPRCPRHPQAAPLTPPFKPLPAASPARPYRTALCAAPQPPPPQQSNPPDTPAPVAAVSPRIPNTPCFTPRVISSPMPQSHRAEYLHAAAAATAEYLSEYTPGVSAPVSQVTLLVPQLNSSLDVYDRRFLLQLVWAVIDITAASCNLRTRVLVQGTRAFGAIPLSVAGLRRMLDADLNASSELWPEGAIRSGFLENEDDLDADDQIVIVVSPTNAVSIPVIDSLVDMVGRAQGRPVILINPKLTDVPSHSGVMQVAGRSDRISFMEAVQDIFYLRLLFKAGTLYPVRGILFRAFPGEWQVWCSENGDLDYRQISSSTTRPTPTDITADFSADTYAQQRKRLTEAKDQGEIVSIETLLVSPPALALLSVAVALTGARFFGAEIQVLLHSLSSPPGI